VSENRILQFQMSGRLVMGVGAVAQLGQVVERLGGGTVLVVTDPGLVQAGICLQVTQKLDDAKISWRLYDKVEPDPRIEIVNDCLEVAKAGACDILIGLGGGSSLDITKVVSVMLTNGGKVSDYVGIDKIPRRGLPMILIPTTAGTGSEVTPIAVLSDKAEQLKKGLVSDKLYADVALIDPQLSISLPARVTAFTGMDALTHAIEVYTNKFADPFIDVFALEATRLIAIHLRTAVHEGSNIEARSAMSTASLLGGLGLGAVNTAAVHALAYPLGGEFNVPHGVANSLLLPYVMEFNLPAAPERFAKLAQMMGEDISGLSAMDAGKKAVDAVARLSADIGIVSSMQELGIPESSIEGMAHAAMKVTRLLNNNPRELSVDDARMIYQKAYNGIQKK
jgi:alcohol dehydrogenase class IV